MKLKDSKLHDVFIGDEEISELSKASRWLVVAHVNTRKYFSAEAFKDTMKFTWGLANDPEIHEADNNLFVIQLFCFGDWNRVMYQGPWIFRGLMVIIEEYDGKGRLCDVVPDMTHVLAQIHDLPDLYRSQPIVDQLVRRIGHVKSVDMNRTRVYDGNYVRVRAKISVAETLKRFAPLNLNGNERIFLPVKYEKIGFFCEVCGILGHIKEECGDGVHGEVEIEYGNVWWQSEGVSRAPKALDEEILPKLVVLLLEG